MLADVIKQREKERIRISEEEKEKYNHPYKRDTIIYFDNVYVIGGIQTWIQSLGKYYEFSVVYDKGSPERLKFMNDLGIETIRYVGQDIECNTLIYPPFGDPNKIKAKKRILVLHGDYKELKIDKFPEFDEVYSVTEVTAKHFEDLTGVKAGVLHNPVEIIPTTKPLIFGVFSRLSKEKGKWRVQYLINKLKAQNKPFLMLVFTDFPFESDENVVMMKPIMNVSGWIEKCDYIIQLSDTEASPLTVQEALKLGKPVIVTKLPMLEELGINETNAKILEFDMSNLDVEDLWNIPKFKWQEHEWKEWDNIMKKKVFREKYTEEDVQNVAKAIKIHSIEEDKKVEEVVDEIIEESKEKKKKTTKKVK